MKYASKGLFLVMVLLMLTACGGKNTQQPAAATGPVEYRITVLTESGEPVKGAMVQLCSDVCVPGVTDEAGEAVLAVPGDNYKVSFIALPEGYDYADETREFLLEAGKTELTIRLKPVS